MTGKMSRTRAERDAIEARAAHWVVRLESDPDAAERAEAERWIDADPLNSIAFVAAQVAWERAAHVRIRDVPPASAPKWMPHASDRLLSRRALGASLLAASAVAAVGLGARASFAGDRHQTARGEQSVARLTDGSSISLNTETAIDVRMSGACRRVRFLDGEALFDVARDVKRPFVVDLGSFRIEVLGTSFNVRKRQEAVELTVTHGLVSVVGADGRAAKVRAGETTLIRPDLIATTELDPGVLRQRVAWQDGYIELDDERLEQAVSEFNRYRESPILIADPRIASLNVAGRFGVHEGAAFVAALRSSFGILADEASDGTVLLRRGAASI
jgi:transmembrane sensor